MYSGGCQATLLHTATASGKFPVQAYQKYSWTGTQKGRRISDFTEKGQRRIAALEVPPRNQ
jgi:hypothetical protein